MNYKTLQQIPGTTNVDQTPVLRFHYLVTYNGGANVLTPNQVLPVWDAQDLRLRNGYEVRAYLAVLLGNTLITEPGTECPELEYVDDVLSMVGQNDPTILQEQLRLENTMLGAIGGERLIRPDLVASSGVPMSRRPAPGDQSQLEQLPMGVLEWRSEMEGIPVNKTGQIPLPKFYYEDPAGAFEGINPLKEGDPIRLSLFPIPFGFDNTETLGLTKPEVYGEADYLIKMTASVRRFISDNKVQGSIYLGWDVPEFSSGVMMEYELQMSMDEYLSGAGFDNPVYELPYNPAYPLAAVNQGIQPMTRRFVSGRGSLNRRFNPGPRTGAPRPITTLV